MEGRQRENPREGPSAEAEMTTLVTFRLERQMYALPIEPIVRIIEMVAITPLLQVHAAVEGVINVHGQAVPVINLRRLFGLPAAAIQLRTPIILVQPAERMYGLIVDEVVDIIQLPAAHISRVADILPEGVGEAPVLRGLAHGQNQTMLVVDLDHLLSATHLKALIRAVSELAASESTAEAEQAAPPVEPPAGAEKTPKKQGRRKKGSSQ